MAVAVVTVAAGGMPVVDVTATTPKLGLPVTENARGIPVTKVTLPRGGLPVTFVAVESGGGGSVTTTLDPANKHSSVSLSNGNLTSTGTTGGNTDASVYSTTTHSTGKYYVEVTATTVTRGFAGIQQTTELTSSFPGINNNGISCVDSGTQFVKGGFPSVGATTTFTNGNVVSLAIDLDAKLIWQRVGAGNWNVSGTANPATGVGGVAITPAGPFWFAIVTANTATSMTVNFGAAAFTQTPPSGFGTW